MTDVQAGRTYYVRRTRVGVPSPLGGSLAVENGESKTTGPYTQAQAERECAAWNDTGSFHAEVTGDHD